MKLTVLTPLKKLIENAEINEIFVPGIEGTLDVLPEHANFLTELETGVLRWKTEDGWFAAAMSYGWMEVFDQKITILADVAETSSNINLDRAKAAEQVARAKIEEGGLSDDNFRKYQLKLSRAMARLGAGSENS